MKITTINSNNNRSKMNFQASFKNEIPGLSEELVKKAEEFVAPHGSPKYLVKLRLFKKSTPDAPDIPCASLYLDNKWSDTVSVPWSNQKWEDKVMNLLQTIVNFIPKTP